MNADSSSCQVDDTELLAYRDGELAPARRSTLAAHVEGCPSCQARLMEAARLTETLRLSSPERDQPVARAAIHRRIAGERTTWWRQRVVIGTVLPAVALLMVIGVNRWLDDDRCDSCPPLPTPMQITATSGLPAGWGALLPCPAASMRNRSLVQASSTSTLPAARALAASVAAPDLGQDAKRHPGDAAKATSRGEPPGRAGSGQADRQVANSGPGCVPGVVAKQPGLNNGPALGATTNLSNPPGS